MTIQEDERIRSLIIQHKEFERSGYDGHNRHSGIMSMRGFGVRRTRREWNRRLHQTVETWNSGQQLGEQLQLK